MEPKPSKKIFLFYLCELPMNDNEINPEYVNFPFYTSSHKECDEAYSKPFKITIHKKT